MSVNGKQEIFYICWTNFHNIIDDQRLDLHRQKWTRKEMINLKFIFAFAVCLNIVIAQNPMEDDG